jgi:hypothetical protein
MTNPIQVGFLVFGTGQLGVIDKEGIGDFGMSGEDWIENGRDGLLGAQVAGDLEAVLRGRIRKDDGGNLFSLTLVEDDLVAEFRNGFPGFLAKRCREACNSYDRADVAAFFRRL